MIYLFAIFGILGSIVLFHRKKNLEKTRETRTLTYFFCKNSLDFLHPFSMVSIIFMLLSMWFSMQDLDGSKLSELIKFEQMIASFPDKVAVLSLSAGQSLMLLFAIFLLSILRLPGKSISTTATNSVLKRVADSLFKIFDKYQKSLKYIIIATTLAASITFFGQGAGEPSKILAAKIKFAQQGYAENRVELKETLESTFLDETYRKIDSGFINSFTKLLENAAKIRKKAAEVGTDYANKSTQFIYKYQTLERRLAGFSEEANAIKNLSRVREETVNRKHSENTKKAKSKISNLSEKYKQKILNGKRVLHDGDLSHISIKNNQKLSTKIKAAAQKLAQKSPPVLFNQAGKKLTPAALNYFLSRMAGLKMSALTQNVPLIGSLIDVLYDTTQDRLTASIEKMTDELMSAASNKESFVLEKEIEVRIKELAQESPFQNQHTVDRRLNLLQVEQRKRFASLNQAKRQFDEGLIAKIRADNKRMMNDLRRKWSSLVEKEGGVKNMMNSSHRDLRMKLGISRKRVIYGPSFAAQFRNPKIISIPVHTKLIDNFINGARDLENPFEQHSILREALATVKDPKQRYYKKVISLKRIAKSKMANTSHLEAVVKAADQLQESHLMGKRVISEMPLPQFSRTGPPRYPADFTLPKQRPIPKSGYGKLTRLWKFIRR